MKTGSPTLVHLLHQCELMGDHLPSCTHCPGPQIITPEVAHRGPAPGGCSVCLCWDKGRGATGWSHRWKFVVCLCCSCSGMHSPLLERPILRLLLLLGLSLLAAAATARSPTCPQSLFLLQRLHTSQLEDLWPSNISRDSSTPARTQGWPAIV
jgi:hypothetical protein